MHKITVRAAALASVWLVPLAAYAAAADETGFDLPEAPPNTQEFKRISGEETSPYQNSIEAGAMYRSSTSPLANRFQGDAQGFGGIGNFLLRGRENDASDPLNTRYFEFRGKDLGYDSRSVGGKLGDQGTWGVAVNYEGTPYVQSTSFMSIYNRDGSFRNGVRAGQLANPIAGNYSIGNGLGSYVASSATNGSQIAVYLDAGMENLPLTAQTVGTKRDAIGLTGKWNLSPEWTLTGGFKHEHKDGTKENSWLWGISTSISPTLTGSQGTQISTTRGIASNLMYFPEPIDYDTDRYDLALQYQDRRLQGQFSYTFSKFADNLTAFSGQNPLDQSVAGVTGGTTSTLNIPVGTYGYYALPPSNTAHQLKMQLGYNLTPSTRINANAGYSMMFQNANQPLMSGNANDSTFGSTAGGDGNNIANHFSGFVDNTFANAAITTRPFTQADAKASYTLDRRTSHNNFENQNSYLNDSTDNMSRVHNWVYSVPYSLTNQTMKVEAGYRVLPETRLSLGYTYKVTDRSYTENDHTEESTVSAGVRSAMTDWLTGSAGYSHGVRASQYDPAAGMRAASFQGGDQIPAFEMNNMAPRTRDEGKTSLGFDFGGNANVSLNGRYAYDHYGVGMGITQDRQAETGFDVSTTPLTGLTAHAFYSYELIQYAEHMMTAANNGTSNSGYDQWNNTDVHTAGVVMEYKPADEWKFNAGWNMSYGSTVWKFGTCCDTAGTVASGGLTVLNTTNILLTNMTAPPDDISILNTFHIDGEYKLQDNLSLWLGYTAEINRVSDYNYTIPAQSTAYSAALLPGEANPSYVNHIIGTSLRAKW